MPNTWIQLSSWTKQGASWTGSEKLELVFEDIVFTWNKLALKILVEADVACYSFFLVLFVFKCPIYWRTCLLSVQILYFMTTNEGQLEERKMAFCRRMDKVSAVAFTVWLFEVYICRLIWSRICPRLELHVSPCNRIHRGLEFRIPILWIPDSNPLDSGF